jgi:hypothetical protein
VLKQTSEAFLVPIPCTAMPFCSRVLPINRFFRLAQIIVGTGHAWQAGHKTLQRLGNTPADPNPSGQRSRCEIGFLSDVLIETSARKSASALGS